jgi:metal-responsive CopG/Arc/MetJ family transcriptional regulator
MPRKILIAIPSPMLERMDEIAQAEHRTRSDLVREAIRRYIENFTRNHPVRPPIAQSPPTDYTFDPTGVTE